MSLKHLCVGNITWKSQTRRDNCLKRLIQWHWHRCYRYGRSCYTPNNEAHLKARRVTKRGEERSFEKVRLQPQRPKENGWGCPIVKGSKGEWQYGKTQGKVSVLVPPGIRAWGVRPITGVSRWLITRELSWARSTIHLPVTVLPSIYPVSATLSNERVGMDNRKAIFDCIRIPTVE